MYSPRKELFSTPMQLQASEFSDLPLTQAGDPRESHQAPKLLLKLLEKKPDGKSNDDKRRAYSLR